jgi:hypothetical protein
LGVGKEKAKKQAEKKNLKFNAAHDLSPITFFGPN